MLSAVFIQSTSSAAPTKITLRIGSTHCQLNLKRTTVCSIAQNHRVRPRSSSLDLEHVVYFIIIYLGCYDRCTTTCIYRLT